MFLYFDVILVIGCWSLNQGIFIAVEAGVGSGKFCGILIWVFSELATRGPQNRPQYILLLVSGTPKKATSYSHVSGV